MSEQFNEAPQHRAEPEDGIDPVDDSRLEDTPLGGPDETFADDSLVEDPVGDDRERAGEESRGDADDSGMPPAELPDEADADAGADVPPAELPDLGDSVDDVEPVERDLPDTDSPASTGTPAPETGDLVIDAALRDLADAPQGDLDAQIERGEQVQRTLQGRLGDLGG